MQAPAILLAAAAALGIFMVAVGIASARGGSGVNARLERYTSGRPAQATKAPTATGQGPISDLIAQSAAIAQLNKAVEQRDFGAKLSRELARADLPLRVSEYLLIWCGAIIGVPVVMFILSFVFPVLGNPIILLIGAVIGFFIPRFWIRRRQSKRLGAFNKQLPDTITLLANALRAGSSFLQAIELVVRESRPPINLEFSRVIREVNLGLPFEQALENLVRRVRSEDLELMATAISIQYQVGGNLAEILDSIAYTIRERIRIKGEIRSLTAQQRMSGYVVAFLPIALAGFLFVIAPDFLKPMFSNKVSIGGIPAGIVLMGFGIFSMFVGFMIIRRVVDIEV
jgi:tight adherence protein B